MAGFLVAYSLGVALEGSHNFSGYGAGFDRFALADAVLVNLDYRHNFFIRGSDKGFGKKGNFAFMDGPFFDGAMVLASSRIPFRVIPKRIPCLGVMILSSITAKKLDVVPSIR